MTRIARSVSPLLAIPAIASLIASTAYGHARLKSPTPRDSHSDYKSPPVGNVGIGEPCGVARAASQPTSTLTAGAQITVTFEETVNHPGCFVVDFSPADDANFVKLAAKSHMNPPAPTTPSTTNPRQWSVSVTLPSTPCTACTLRLRQLMLSSDLSDSACPPATIPAGETYYSCANVVLSGGSSGTGGAGAAGGTSGSGGRGGGGGDSAGRGGTTGSAGVTGQAGSAGAGQAGTTGTAGNGASGQAGTTGSSGQAGTGTSGAAGSSGPSGGDDASGGCAIAGDTPAPLGLLLALVVLRWRRRRSRS
jgi:hypothetical protein